MDPLITVEELAKYLGHDATEFAADPASDLVVANASGIVRDYCRWSIYPQDAATFQLDGTGTTYLSLPTLFLVTVEEVRVDGTALDGTDYQWSTRGQLYRAGVWPARMRAVEVDCEHGYEVTPDAVRAVTMVLAASMVTNPEGLRSKTVGAVSKSFVFETMRGPLSELQISQLGAYRIPL